MKQPKSKWMPLISAAVVVATFSTQTVQAELLEKTKKVGRATVRYKVVLPNGYDPAKAYPAILAFGGGPQSMNTVDGVLDRNFRAEAEKRGYIVVAPAAPNDEVFFEEGARIFPVSREGRARMTSWQPSRPGRRAKRVRLQDLHPEMINDCFGKPEIARAKTQHSE